MNLSFGCILLCYNDRALVLDGQFREGGKSDYTSTSTVYCNSASPNEHQAHVRHQPKDPLRGRSPHGSGAGAHPVCTREG